MKSKETEAVINYSFTAVPTQLFYLLDNNCRTLLFTLIQASTYYYKNEDGYFFITKESIKELTDLSKNIITAALDTLYINNLVSIITVGGSNGKIVNHYKVNEDEFIKYEKLSFEDLKNPENKIYTVKYKNNYQPQYIKDNTCKKVTTKLNNVCKKVTTKLNNVCKKVTTNIDNINNIDNKNNINKEYINNILIEKEIIINNNKEKELEVMETRSKEQTSSSDKNIINNVASFNNNLEGKKEQTPTRKTFEEKFEILLERMSQSQSLEELDDKLQKLANWLQDKIDNDSSINVNSVMVKASEVHRDTTSRLKKAIKDTLSDDNSTISITALEDEDNAAESLKTSEIDHIKNKYLTELDKDIQLLKEIVQFGNSYSQYNYNKAQASRILDNYSDMTDTYKEDEVIKNKLQIIINLSEEILNFTPKEEPVPAVVEDDDEDDGSIPFE